MAGEPKPGLLERFPALRKLRAGGRVRRMPVILQMTATDCGLACLGMVLGYFGREVTLEDLRQVLGSNRDGVTARELLAAARQYGLRARGVSMDLDRLPFLEPGAILHWRFSHYVVFEGLTRHGVRIVDPAQGRRVVTREQFSQSFTGVALLLEPSADFQPQQLHQRRIYRHASRLFEYGDVLTRIVVLSGALQLFALSLPMLTGMLADRVIPRGDWYLLWVLAAGMGILILFHCLASLIRSHLLIELRTRMDSAMTLGFLEHLVGLAYPFFQVRPAGDLMMRLNINASIREILSSGLISTLLDGSMVLLYFVLLFVADTWMGLTVLVLGALQVLIFAVARRRQRELLARNLELDAKNQNFQFQMLTGIQTLKTLGVEQQAVQDYSNLFVDVLNVSLARGRLTAWVDTLTSTLRMGSPLIVLLLGAQRVLAGELSLGGMLGLAALASALLVPLSNLVGTAAQLQYLSTYLERINEVLDVEPERSAERPGLRPVVKGGIELDRVSFRYSPTSPLVVQELSIQLPPGKLVAIVGRSGAGKSTLAHLLLGLYLPTSGRILFDGMDLAELDLRWMRNQMGVVQQEPSFFGGTIRENIALGQAGLPLEAIMAAAKLAQVHDDIMAMPLQYDTPLADRGLSLSGGQRQRLALARALVRRPVMLLLDEATSALDAITERQVQQALATLDCTRVVIAHRLSTIIEADLILVMDGGRLVEAGTHADLLTRGGVYGKLVQAQLERSSA